MRHTGKKGAAATITPVRIAKAGVRMLYSDAAAAAPRPVEDFVVVDTPETVATRALSGSLSTELRRQGSAGGADKAADADAGTASTKPDKQRPAPGGGGSGTPATSGGGGAAVIVEAEDVDVLVRQGELAFKAMSAAAERLASDMKALAARAAVQPRVTAGQQPGATLALPMSRHASASGLTIPIFKRPACQQTLFACQDYFVSPRHF